MPTPFRPAPRATAWPLVFPALLASALLAAGALGGCAFAPPAQVPAAVVPVPERYDEAELAGDYAPLRWWQAYDDPALDRLIDSTLTENLDLAEAVARVAEVRARYRVARGALLPSAQGTGDVQVQSQPANTGLGAAFGGQSGGAAGDTTGMGGAADTTGSGGARSAPDRFEFTTYSVALGASYELDLWSRARLNTRAALAEVAASEADLRTVRLGVLAETITAYFDVVTLRRRIALAVESIGLLAERVALTETRYDRGLVSSFELYTVRQEYRNAQAQLPLLEAQVEDAKARLAVLVGRYPQRLEALLPDTLAPEVVRRPVPPGLAPDLLLQRPDVRAAARRLEAARLRVGARRAELLPSVSLSGQVGLQADEPDRLFRLDQWFANLTAGLTAPLFQGGRLRANVDVAEAQYAQRAAAYGRTVLTAYQEVEGALEQLEEQLQRYAFLEEQLDQAQASVELQTQRFEAGLADYLAFLDALRNLVAVQTTLAQAEREVALSRLALHRALGGGWTDAPPAPTVEFVDAEAVDGRLRDAIGQPE